MLPGRGTTFVREVEGPPGAPTVLLLHGLVASGGLNWFQVFEPLSRHFRVIAPDLRGHGRGIRSRRRFHLRDCADDAAAVLEALEVDEALVVGYSMGGPVAQLVWKRHPDRVAGLVLCATGAQFVPDVRERLVFLSMMALAAGTTRFGQAIAQVPLGFVQRRVPFRGRRRSDSFRAWAAAEMRRHDWRMVLEAARAVGAYDASRWIDRIDVPTAVMVTTEDRAIPESDQLRLVSALPHATVHRLAEGHVACMKPEFAEPLVSACLDVAARIDRQLAEPGPGGAAGIGPSR